MRKILIGCFLVLSIALIFFAFKAYDHFFLSPASYLKQEIIFPVERGQSFKTIADNLQNQGLIGHKDAFYLFARLSGSTSKVKAGEYLLSTDMSALQILDVLVSGKSFERKITITEGLNVFEIAEIFQEKGIATQSEFLKLVRNPTTAKKYLGEAQESLEGYLFPETYSFTRFTPAEKLVEKMVDNFKAVWSELSFQLPKGWTRHQVVTLASIVEKETGAPDERPLIASVFLNRLRKNMLLQTDPTILYGMADLSGKLESNIRKADILRPTRFNTYVIKGLPPGPISNPGKDALLAIFKPAQSNYLFFVSMNEGRHAFSETYQQHSEAVKKYQLDRKARQGKSWRDLNKENKLTETN